MGALFFGSKFVNFLLTKTSVLMKKYYTIFVIILLMQSVYCQKNDQFVTDIAYLPEMLISSNNTQTALDFYSINIIDYRVFGESILSLKKEKGHYYIGIEHDSKTAEVYPLAIKRPRSVFIDCFNNVHILNDNFAYQVYISTKVEIVEQVKLEDFKNSIEKC